MVQLHCSIILMRVNIHFKMAQFTKANGKTDKGTDKACKSGQMVRDTKASGIRTRLMVGEYSIMLTATYSMDSGNTIRLMDSEHITMRTEVNMKVSGLTICRTVKAKRLGKINQPTKVVTIKVRNMERVYMYGLMVACITANGLIIKFKDTEYTNGLMAEFITENGTIIKCMAKGP